MVGELAVMGKKGDTKVVWNSENTDEVANAQRTFDDLRAKGYLAYKVLKGGDKGEVMTKFNPEAERIILAPPVVGG